ncbi:Putative DNA-binding protein in cluster with Type I restriction-modification system [Indibacter alkaliphilus LW1]|uniref:DNA-binding protein in cluster with Type I restriction-modification system n=1 Tax=Indibacter alkaliphilus (strain CCUG 57479 / KCTC 22604 / LW1) TaxID=1189612 RepID=S2DST8_INDAL|nr:virulence protein RhuM/Fic/DOC family protein [Indibacter alkaliphilus]EOZ95116.1 Putative DNA-binding protein in cluster with Type I restriction-modification system [Indibacter alkaliphilus LW1]
METVDFNSEIVVFKPSQGSNEFEIILDGEHDTVWVTEQQLVELFGKARRTIGEHIRNIYKEGELEKESTWRNFRQVQKEGERKVKRAVSAYNLDVVISVGYRVKSPVGIEFRKWATQRLKDYLVQGYAINSELLSKQGQKIIQLENQLDILREKTFESQRVLTEGFLDIISKYSKSFELLNRYDSEDLQLDNLSKEIIYVINYEDVKKAIHQLKRELIQKGEAGELFGNEKDDSFRGILGSISQTVFGELAYPTIEEQAAQLLYSVIKGHAFSDGNKRIGSFLFVWFLEQNSYHLDERGVRKINENTLVALALAVAQSLPEQRDLMIKLIVNLIKN